MRYANIVVCIVLFFVCSRSLSGQTPSSAAASTQSNEGFYPGWGFGARLEGSTEKTLNYASTIHLGAPTGDTKKGFSNGHATWNWSNHFEHGWGNFTPFVDGGVGNSVPDTKYFHRPLSTFGYNAQFEGGTEMDAGPFSLSASVYDIAPWGNQTVVSKVFRCTSGTKCSATGTTTNRKNYLNTNVSTGGASLTRDNGFNAGIEFKPDKAEYLDLEADYSQSVPLWLNTFSFRIAVDMAALLRGTGK